VCVGGGGARKAPGACRRSASKALRPRQRPPLPRLPPSHRRAQEVEPGFCEPDYWMGVTSLNQARPPQCGTRDWGHRHARLRQHGPQCTPHSDAWRSTSLLPPVRGRHLTLTRAPTALAHLLHPPGGGQAGRGVIEALARLQVCGGRRAQGTQPGGPRPAGCRGAATPCFTAAGKSGASGTGGLRTRHHSLPPCSCGRPLLSPLLRALQVYSLLLSSKPGAAGPLMVRNTLQPALAPVGSRVAASIACAAGFGPFDPNHRPRHPPSVLACPVPASSLDSLLALPL
jgi:hypothetical protein